MCGRFTITTDPEKLARRFGIQIPEADWRPRYNAAPTQVLPVVLNTEPARANWLKWGLVPSWAADAAIGNRMINARAETLTQKPSFRTPLRKRRCLVLADGFYEWKKLPQGKQPMRIVRADGEPFAMAGLWETWRDPGGDLVRTFAIITTDANDMMREIHDRMPVILPGPAERVWLSDQSDEAEWLALLRPFPAGELKAYPVSKRVNSPTHDDPALIAAA